MKILINRSIFNIFWAKNHKIRPKTDDLHRIFNAVLNSFETVYNVKISILEL